MSPDGTAKEVAFKGEISIQVTRLDVPEVTDEVPTEIQET
jgi:hypothetical protein